MLRLRAILFVVLFALFAAPFAVRAQDSRIPITLYIPDYMTDQFNESMFARFEAENPNYKVVIKTGENIYYTPAAFGLDSHLTDAQEYASSADVLFVNNFTLSIESTRAGLFLDLRPLIGGDMAFDTGDFLPGMLESFSWDNGVWALPAVADTTMLIYDPAKFDAAGINYPNENWTLDDLGNAARALTVRNAENAVEVPGFLSFQTHVVLRGFAGQSWYDPMTGMARFTDPALVQLLQTWYELSEEGVINGEMQVNSTEVPLRLDGTWALQAPFRDDQVQMSGAVMPSGAILQATGFAVSGGTANPEAAYALAKYLTGEPGAVNALYATTPARRSMIGTSNPDMPSSFNRLSPENQALVDVALANPIPGSELHLSNYLTLALDAMTNNGGDALAALQEVEAQANANLQAASERRSTAVVQVPTPMPTPSLNTGEVSLRFGVGQTLSPNPMQTEWEDAINNFTATDSQVRQIVLDTVFPEAPVLMAQKYDCFYLPSNAVGEDTSMLLNLDPFFDSDFNFDESDYLPGVLDQVTRNDRIWALPIDLQPLVLRYDSRQFAELGIPEPMNGWTVDQFADALNRIKTDNTAPFQVRYFGGTHMLMLIAAYGGLPLDFRTGEPTIRFTDPATVEAIRQVLDLARNDFIAYSELFNNSGGVTSADAPIFAHVLNIMWQSSFGDAPTVDMNDPYRLIGFPRGTQYVPMSYDLGALYISAQTPNPEACYRWISAIANSPELFSAIPVRRSLLNDESLGQLQVADVAGYYDELQAALTDPNLIVFPSPFASGTGAARDYILYMFLYRAFDNYVVDGADLETELANAETLALGFQGCTANILPPTSAEESDMTEYYRQFLECAVLVDPTLAPMFGL
jgi:ABC-type glycerol-3-phosphate transport system substrate-binding protein